MIFIGSFLDKKQLGKGFADLKTIKSREICHDPATFFFLQLIQHGSQGTDGIREGQGFFPSDTILCLHLAEILLLNRIIIKISQIILEKFQGTYQRLDLCRGK